MTIDDGMVQGCDSCIMNATQQLITKSNAINHQALIKRQAQIFGKGTLTRTIEARDPDTNFLA